MIEEDYDLPGKGDKTFHVKVYIPETKPVVLVFLLHGLADHGGRFRNVAEHFSREGFILFAPDLIGNGKSSGKRGHFSSYDGLMDDIEFLLAKATHSYPGIPVFIYGQSMGGNLALNYCMRRNPAISGVISASPWLRLTKPPNAIVKIMGNALGTAFPTIVIPNGLNAEDLTHSNEIINAYRNDPLVHGKISLNTFRIITKSGEWAIENAFRLRIPLLLMHGTADLITSRSASEQFSRNLNKPHTFRTWEGLRHELHNEIQGDAIIQYICQWIHSISKDYNQ
jgi:alpha-beta hydrolase superfamily lysophospholipase